MITYYKQKSTFDVAAMLMKLRRFFQEFFSSSRFFTTPLFIKDTRIPIIFFKTFHNFPPLYNDLAKICQQFFCPVAKTGSLRRFQRQPSTYEQVSKVRLLWLWIRINLDQSQVTVKGRQFSPFPSNLVVKVTFLFRHLHNAHLAPLAKPQLYWKKVLQPKD